MRQAEVWDPSKHPPPLRSIPSVHEPARRFQPTLGRCVLVAARRLLPTTGKMHGTSTRQCGILWHFDNENCSSNKSKNAVQQRQQHHHQKYDIESRWITSTSDEWGSQNHSPKKRLRGWSEQVLERRRWCGPKQPANHEISSPRPPKVGHFRLRAWSEFGAFSGFTGCGEKTSHAPLLAPCRCSAILSFVFIWEVWSLWVYLIKCAEKWNISAVRCDKNAVCPVPGISHCSDDVGQRPRPVFWTRKKTADA